jgi:hypothetical protein
VAKKKPGSGGETSGGDRGAGEVVDTLTGRDHDWPTLRQFNVFLENSVGRLHQLLRLLEERHIRIVALSVANSVDCAFARLMVHDSDRARELLRFSQFAFVEIDLVGVEVPDSPQPFVQIFLALLQAELNIQYTYPLIYRRNGRGAIAMYVDDIDLALKTLGEKGLEVVTERDLLLADDF